MSPEEFLREFGGLAETGKTGELRRLVQRLAITGRLTQQHADDGDPTAVLAGIAQKRQQLVSERKASSSNVQRLTQVPYQAPDGWIWVPFGEATICRDGQRIPISRVERETRQGKYPYYGASGVIDTIDDFLFDEPLLLIGEDGANLLNRSTPIAFIAGGQYWVNNHAHVLDGYSEDYLRYLALFINATDLSPYVTGTAQPKMNQAKMNSIPTLIPPLPEQKRIVEKVDQLMALCDELEERQKQKREKAVSFNKAALHAVVHAPDKSQLKSSWSRVQDHFEVLYELPENVKELRQTILQLAVMGKLVRGNPNEEPASWLIERISKNRAILADQYATREGPSTDGKGDPVPSSWESPALVQLGVFLGGGTPSKSSAAYWSGTIPWVSPKDMKVLWLKDSQDHVSESAIRETAIKLIPSGSLLCVVRGMILAHSFPVTVNTVPVTINQDMKALVPAVPEVAPYLLLALRGLRDTVLEKVERSSHGTCRLASEDLGDLRIPLPPLPEQKRIVEKVDQLMALCDALEAKSAQHREHGQRLMQAVVEGLVA